MRASTFTDTCDDRHGQIAALRPKPDYASTQNVGTAQWRVKDRYSLWTDFTKAHSAVLAMPSTPVHDFRVTATLQLRGEVVINQAIMDPGGFLRTPRHAANLRTDCVRISYCARVDGGIESGGSAARIADRSVYFRDYRGPGCFWSHGAVEETWLFVPREWLVESGKAAQLFDCAVFQSDTFLTGLLAQRIQAVARHANDEPEQFDATIRNLRATIEDAFAARANESHRKTLLVKAERLRRIRAFLARHVADPDLSPDLIADKLGIARSTLYRLLQDEGLQINAVVAEHRLTAIARMLRDPAWATQSIGEIASLWGHLDPAYFARAFKRRFGQTPSLHRSAGPADGERAFR